MGGQALADDRHDRLAPALGDLRVAVGGDEALDAAVAQASASASQRAIVPARLGS